MTAHRLAAAASRRQELEMSELLGPGEITGSPDNYLTRQTPTATKILQSLHHTLNFAEFLLADVNFFSSA